jgi:hypothetical protein
MRPMSSFVIREFVRSMVFLDAIQHSAGFVDGENAVNAPDGSEKIGRANYSAQRSRCSSVATRLIAPIIVATRTTNPVIVVAILPVSTSSRLFIFAATASIVLDIVQISWIVAGRNVANVTIGRVCAIS